jgi:hypothetical protein
MLIVLPGSVGPRRRLVDVLRAQHNDRVDAHKLDVAYREKHGIPSTPDIDWGEERRRIAAIAQAVEQEDPALVRLGAMAALTAMSAAPQDPGPFVEPEGLGDVVVSPRVVSARTWREMRAAYAAALEANDREAVERAENNVLDECIERIEGLQYSDGEAGNEYQLEHSAFRAAGLTPYLLVAVFYLQSLPSGKAWHSGVQPLTT